MPAGVSGILKAWHNSVRDHEVPKTRKMSLRHYGDVWHMRGHRQMSVPGERPE